jgi:DNA-binding beta-propeller fold protein YncE
MHVRALASVLVAAVSLSVAAVEPAAAARRVVWTALEDDGELAKVDVRDREVLRRVRTRGGGPHNIVVGPDGTVAAALWASDRIVMVRKGARTFVELGGAPHDVKIARNLVVVANQGSGRVQLVRLDGTLVRRVLLRADPHDLAIDPQRRHAWVTLEGSDDLAVVDLLHRDEPVRYVSTGERPHDILFAPDGRLWVTDWEGALHVYEGRRARLVRSVPLGVEAHHLDFTSDGRLCWITDHGAEALFVVRVRTVRVVERIAFPGEPHHVTVTADGERVVVADHEGGRLVVYDADTREMLRTIPVGDGPHGVWAVGS